MTFRVCDNGLPSRCTNSTGIVTITRNQFPPFFVSEPYTKTINENFPVGDTVLRLSSQDNDQVGELVFEATTVSYPFEVDRFSGAVTLQYNILYVGPAFYSVSENFIAQT